MKTDLKILVAEHDPTDLDLLCNEFQKNRIAYILKVVKNKIDYVLAIEEFKPDIILSDYTFPSFDGPQAFRIREDIAPDIPFIFVSGTIGEERSIELIKCGVTDYCLKDKLYTLIPKVVRALNESKVHLQNRQVEQELKRSERRLASAQQMAQMGNWEWSSSTRDFIWSEELYRIVGLTPNQQRHSLAYVLSFIHADDLDRFTKEMKASQYSLKGFSITFRIVNNSKKTRHIYLDGKIEMDSAGNAIGLFGTAQDITERVLLETTLTHERLTKQKEITDAVLTAQENERSEIGKELRENLSQVLSATKLFIDLAKTDEQLRPFYLDKSSKYLTSVIDQIRKISKDLVTPSTSAMSLFDSIVILKDDLTLMHRIKIKFQIDNINEKELAEKLKLNLYRIVQEQLNNIVKHASATDVHITLRREGNAMILIISDNGIGYNVCKNEYGLGIRNIMSRVELFNGSTRIQSKTGDGYKLEVQLPYKWPHDKLEVLA